MPVVLSAPRDRAHYIEVTASEVTDHVEFDDAALVAWKLFHYPTHVLEIVGAGATMDVSVRLPSGAWGPWLLPDGTPASGIAPGEFVLIDKGRWEGIRADVTLGGGGGDATEVEVYLRSMMT